MMKLITLQDEFQLPRPFLNCGKIVHMRAGKSRYRPDFRIWPWILVNTCRHAHTTVYTYTLTTIIN